MSSNPPVDPAPDDTEELTPSDRKKFGKFLNEFLEEDDTTPPPTTNPPTPTPSNPASTSFDIDGFNRAMDARESKKTQTDEMVKLRADLDALKPKPKKWHQPWTLFSG